MEDRSSAFQALKPVCIKLSQNALSLSSGRTGPADVVKAQSELLGVLTTISKDKPRALNHQLADYVFFPLSHVLRQYSKLPARALEDCLRCTLILLKTAWASQLEPKLGVQLLNLLTVLVDTESALSKSRPQSSEELQVTIQDCFAETFRALANTKDGREAVLATPNLPQLGKAIYEILNALKNGSSADIQFAALMAVRAFISAVDDDAAMDTSFFPGLVSSLQTVLLPSSTSPRTVKILIGSLEVLSDLLVRTLRDSKTENLPQNITKGTDSGQSIASGDQSWLDATASQVKMVLATVVKLRTHPRQEVRIALSQLCFRLIEQCRKSLASSASFLLETIITLLAIDKNANLMTELRTMLVIDEGLLDLLRTSLHDWLVSLPRVMHSKDDTRKAQLVKQVTVGFQVLSDSGLENRLVDRLVTDQLRDSIVNIIHRPQPRRVQESSIPDVMHFDQLMSTRTTTDLTFDSVVLKDVASVGAFHELDAFIRNLAISSSGTTIAQQMVSSVERLDGDAQVASFWTALRLIRVSLEDQSDTADFLAVRSTSQEKIDEMLEELYYISLEYTDPSVYEEDRDWRLKALSLEAIALYAQERKQDFRSELVDSLYPIVHLMGSENASLQRHAMTCLNLVATASGYQDAKELIVANVDYLVNAVALKLNTFDISAQAPQVLLMMVKLTGPRLLPYLDDLVDSMFAALDAYHGYPKLVETIFTVLLAIAQEGAKTEQLAITANSKTTQRSSINEFGVADIADILRAQKRKRDEPPSQLIEDTAHSTKYPQRPWGDGTDNAGRILDEISTSSQTKSQAPEPDAPSSVQQSDASKPPVPKTYAILLKISELTQHYLTASSPSLRTSLLALLNATFPALSKHENSFLPLINTLWPSVVSRLDDDEAYVVANALEIISCVCTYAGDFMRSRIVTLWPELMKLARQRAKLGSERRRTPGEAAKSLTTRERISAGSAVARVHDSTIVQRHQSAYVDAPTRMLRDSMFNLLEIVTTYVSIDADIFDGILDLVGDSLLEREGLREALERFNSDAVWIKLMRVQSQPSIGAETPAMHREEDRPWAFIQVA